MARDLGFAEVKEQQTQERICKNFNYKKGEHLEQKERKEK